MSGIVAVDATVKGPLSTPAVVARVSSEALQFLAEAATVAPAALGDVTVSSEALGQLAAAHRLLLVWHLDREPRAARVLREINP